MARRSRHRGRSETFADTARTVVRDGIPTDHRSAPRNARRARLERCPAGVRIRAPRGPRWSDDTSIDRRPARFHETGRLATDRRHGGDGYLRRDRDPSTPMPRSSPSRPRVPRCSPKWSGSTPRSKRSGAATSVIASGLDALRPDRGLTHSSATSYRLCAHLVDDVRAAPRQA